jgi:hypothetical protein
MKKGSMTKERLDGANRIIANKEKVNYKRLQDELIGL